MPENKFTPKQLQWIDDYVSKYMSVILKLLNYKVHDTTLSEDLLQEVFCRMLKYVENMIDLEEPHLEYYTRRIIQSVIADHYKGEGDHAENDTSIDFIDMESEYNEYLNPESHIIEQEYLKVLYELPEKYCKVLVAHIFYGMNFKEVGESLGIREATARKRYERARKKLSEKLDENFL